MKDETKNDKISEYRVVEAQTFLKLTDFRRNPLDFAQYPKPSKKVKEELCSSN